LGFSARPDKAGWVGHLQGEKYEIMARGDGVRGDALVSGRIAVDGSGGQSTYPASPIVVRSRRHGVGGGGAGSDCTYSAAYQVALVGAIGIKRAISRSAELALDRQELTGSLNTRTG